MLSLKNLLAALSLIFLAIGCGPAIKDADNETDNDPEMVAGSRELSLELCEEIASACSEHAPDTYGEFECLNTEVEQRVVLAEPRACDDASGVLIDAVRAAARDDPADLAAACDRSIAADDDPVHDCYSRP